MSLATCLSLQRILPNMNHSQKARKIAAPLQTLLYVDSPQQCTRLMPIKVMAGYRWKIMSITSEKNYDDYSCSYMLFIHSLLADYDKQTTRHQCQTARYNAPAFDVFIWLYASGGISYPNATTTQSKWTLNLLAKPTCNSFIHFLQLWSHIHFRPKPTDHD